MKTRFLMNRLNLLTLFLLVTVSTSAFCAPAQQTPVFKPQVLLELVSIPVLFSEDKHARVAVTILPCNICQATNGTANGTTTCDRTVTVRITLRTLAGVVIGDPVEGKVGIGGSLVLDELFDPADFGDLERGNIIATVCVTSCNNGKKKYPCCCGIVNASLQVYGIEGDETESDSLTPLLPLVYYQPSTLTF